MTLLEHSVPGWHVSFICYINGLLVVCRFQDSWCCTFLLEPRLHYRKPREEQSLALATMLLPNRGVMELQEELTLSTSQ